MNALLARDVGLAAFDARLHRDRALDRIDGALEFQQHPIALHLDQPPPEPRQVVRGDVARELAPALDRALLVLLDQAHGIDNVDEEHRS